VPIGFESDARRNTVSASEPRAKAICTNGFEIAHGRVRHAR
jgi:hypothetical protein